MARRVDGQTAREKKGRNNLWQSLALKEKNDFRPDVHGGNVFNWMTNLVQPTKNYVVWKEANRKHYNLCNLEEMAARGPDRFVARSIVFVGRTCCDKMMDKANSTK